MADRTVFLAAGASGISLQVPDSGFTFSIKHTLNSAPVLSAAEQQNLVSAAINSMAGGTALKALARSRRRVVVVVGDLSLPAPYDLVMPLLLNALAENGIRPARIAVLVCPGACAPVLGLAAIRRYGEEIVGAYEFRSWLEESAAAGDPLYAAADLRLVVTSEVAGETALHRLSRTLPPPDLAVHLRLGRKHKIDLAACQAVSQPDHGPSKALESGMPAGEGDGEAILLGGGGADWETTLEEALLSLHHENAPASTLVLAFSGSEGLGSAQFTSELLALLRQAEEVLQQGGALTSSVGGAFDPAGALAGGLGRYKHVILFSPSMQEHDDGEDFREELARHTHLSQHFHFCGEEAELWRLMGQFHAGGCRLQVKPLGWRASSPAGERC